MRTRSARKRAGAEKTDGLMTQLDTLSKSLNNRLDQLDGAKAEAEDLSKSVGRIETKRADIVKQLKKRGIDEAELEFNRLFLNLLRSKWYRKKQMMLYRKTYRKPQLRGVTSTLEQGVTRISR